MNRNLKWGLVAIVLGLGLYFAVSYVTTDAEAQEDASTNTAGVQWSIRCNKAEGQTEPVEVEPGKCEMYQKQTIKDTGQRLVEFAIGYPQGAQNARGIVILPLGIMLQPGLTMQIDEQTPFKFDVRYCIQNGCYAFLELNDDVIKKMSRGDKATLTMMAQNEKRRAIPIPLGGFTKALNQVKS